MENMKKHKINHQNHRLRKFSLYALVLSQKKKIKTEVRTSSRLNKKITFYNKNKIPELKENGNEKSHPGLS